MRLLLCAILVAISCQVILCDDANLIRMINTAIPQIIQGGISEGKLPGGPYYLHHIIKSSIGAQDSHLTLDVRQLDNQTVVTVKATIDNTDFSVSTSCFTSTIGENVWTWTKGWEFSWLYYAPYGRGDYCQTDIQSEYWPWSYYKLSAEQLALDSVIRLTYESLEEAKNGEWKEILDRLDPEIPPGPLYLDVGSDHLCVGHYAGWDAKGKADYHLYSVYQPCTGDRRVFQQVKQF